MTSKPPQFNNLSIPNKFPKSSKSPNKNMNPDKRILNSQ